MQINELKKRANYFEMYKDAQTLKSDEKYAELLDLCQFALSNLELTNDPKDLKIYCQFMYLKAVALDMTDKLEEALAIFLDLFKKYPGCSRFEISARVVLNRLEKRARVLVSKEPMHPDILKIHDLIKDYGSIPYWLTFGVALQEVYKGKAEAAWKRIQDLRALSPNDAEYLTCALSVARAANFTDRAQEIIEHANQLLEERPYRLDLVPLFDGDEKPLPKLAQ